MLHPAVSKISDTAQVVGPNVGMLAFINLSRVNEVGQAVLVGLTIAYTVWRWRRDAKKDR